MATQPNSLATQPPDPKLAQKLEQARNVAPQQTNMSAYGVPDPIASNADLQKTNAELAGAIRKITVCVSKQIMVARRLQIYRTGRSELYFIGKQKIAWHRGIGQWTGVGANGGMVSAYDYEAESFDYTTNFYKGYAESFMTTASENVPGVPFHPEDPNRRDDVEAAKGATSASELVARWNDAPMMMSKLSYHGFTGGLMATYVREVTDGSRFGYEIDPTTGAPTKIPKSRPIISCHGALDISVPMWADSQSDMDYLAWFVDMPRSKVGATYPWLMGQIPGASDTRDDDQLARLFRASIRGNISPSMPADALDDIVTVLRIWLRPSTYWYIEDEKLRNQLLQMFPDGCLAHYAGGKYAASMNENMDDHWAVENATEGRGMARSGIGESFIEVQDQINVLSNLFHEYLVYGIPPIFHHAKALDKEAVQNMTAKPAQYVPVNFQDQVDSIQDLFWNPPPAQVPQALIERLDSLAGQIGQFLTGIFPALVGSGGEGVADKTASGYKMQLQQSMGRVAFFYRRVKSLYQRTMYNAVREFAANRDNDIALSGQDPTKKPQAINPLAIRKGNFNVYAEADDGDPVLFSDKRTLLQQLLEMAKDSPQLQSDLNEPANQSLLKAAFGLSDWVSAGEDARLKQLKEIEEMLQPGVEPEPIKDPNDPDPLTAAIIGYQSSVPIEPLDYDDLEFETCRWWASSDAGLDAVQNNPAGYQNVILHAQAHQQRMQKNTPPPEIKRSMTIPLDKMPPEMIAQEAEKAGDQLSPQDFATQHAMQKDLKATAPPKPDTPTKKGDSK